MNQIEQPSEETTAEPVSTQKQSFWKSSYPLAVIAILLAGGGIAVGYMVGHKQGLTVVGFDADAQELAEIVQKQKKALDTVEVALNARTQERDVAIGNAKELQNVLDEAKADTILAESLNATYRDEIGKRGGLGLTIQNFAIRPLPSDAYEYVLDLIQVNSANRRSTGNIEIRLVGNSEILTVPLEKTAYNFENYERLTGRWTMPKGFTPQYIEVHLSGTAGANVAQRFVWKRGKDEIESPAFISEIPKTRATSD